MKLRDSFKSIDYFDKFIIKRSDILSKSEHKIEKSLIKEDRLYSIINNNFKKYLSLIKAKYSRGDDMFNRTIIKDFDKALESLNKGWEKNRRLISIKEEDATLFLNQYREESYLPILELISIAVLLDIDKDKFELLIKCIDRDGVKDYLYEFLFKSVIEERKDITEESYERFFGINEKYGRLKALINEVDKSKAEKELKYFLENEWYQNFKGTPLYNQHNNQHNIYVGYWCFIAAAIVKIKGLDDSSFRDNEYYPKDMLNNEL